MLIAEARNNVMSADSASQNSVSFLQSESVGRTKATAFYLLPECAVQCGRAANVWE